ncbi:MAG: helix-turn-helix transcriptional regulator, partial [Erysipelotrichaceae bacterium]|nr:helix-turn-helix transcriptional regulator [Erysipelotrichaceae bacterium]
KLKVLMKQHNLTEYKLAQKADVAQSTINSLFRKNNLPTIPTLESLLIAMDMTLSEFFYDEALMKKHELEEQNLLKKWGLLTKDQKQAILKLIELLLDSSCKN